MTRGVTSFSGRKGGQVEASYFLGAGLGVANPFGRILFVDGNQGNNASGRSPGGAFSTMQTAFDQLKSGDTIYVRGNIIENLVAPAGVFDVTILGPATRPRHADAHTGNNGYSSATWKAATQTEPLLRLRQQGWTIANFLLDCPSSDAGLEFIRDAAAGDAERDSSHARVLGCRLASGQTGILITGTENVFDVEVADCIFNDLTTAILGDPAHRWDIRDSVFHTNTNHIDAALKNSLIRRNTFGKFTTKGIDLTGGNDNVVYGNALSGTYSNVGGYTAGTDDEWGGNFNSLAGGVTAADPG